MKNDFENFAGLTVFYLILIVIFYLALFLYNKKGKEEIKMITLYGNSLLTKEQYLRFADLNQSDEYSDLSLNGIKNRIEKHPYIFKAEVKSDGRGNVDIKIKEKEIYAVIVHGSEPYFISADFEFIKILDFTNYSDIPLISNAKLPDKVAAGIANKSDDLIQAFRIIDAARITDQDISKRLAEINLKYGGDVVLTFSGMNYPVIFGRGNEVKKMIYLSIMWDRTKALNLIGDNTSYIDLRFSNEAFIGKKTGTG
ncbi:MULTISPECIES: cell division protein FtsQ/DivIB [Ignavibacterium]|jgi:cell division protein FtsQ|uniref:cell division protein FtsQ/DivIB n=1 Tax=Ignavibacterium TaxID=795750 RepID=UPI0025BCAC48|nr:MULTISPECIES: cell division protein FtsQ/DivIB [Ignavibacterium]MBI5661390.1 hypothetical protein [Ignavibacterium album]